MNKEVEVDMSEVTELQVKLLVKMYGPLISNDHLWRVLGYTSGVAMRSALNRGTLPITSMNLPHRHKKFGLSDEVGRWLIQQRVKNCSSKVSISPKSFDKFIQSDSCLDLAPCGVLLHEDDIQRLLNIESKTELTGLNDSKTLPFPLFRIDNRRTKLFALLLEALPYIDKTN